MWVYQAGLSDSRALVPAEKSGAPGSAEAIVPQKSILQVPLKHPGQKNRQGKDCWLLAAAFLLGTAAAGVLRAFCEQAPQQWMQFYLQRWEDLFAVSDAHTAASIFGMEYLTLAAAATALLLLGFSALGPVLIFLFSMLYGLGNGTLFTRIFPGLPLQRQMLLLWLILLPSAVAAAGLCLLGASALQVSARVRAYAFSSPGTGAARPAVGPAALVRNYLLTMVLFLPLCGVSTAFACIGSRL